MIDHWPLIALDASNSLIVVVPGKERYDQLL